MKDEDLKVRANKLLSISKEFIDQEDFLLDYIEKELLIVFLKGMISAKGES